MNDRVFEVSELNNWIKQLLDSEPGLNRVYVRGELSNYKMYPSGHHYFTIKDKEAALRCVMFKREAEKLRFRPENGMKVVAFGRVTVFLRDGQYQLYCSELTPDGVGDLHVAFEQLKQKLAAEGLFDAQYKKPLPAFPQRIAVITSGAGAAVRDVIRVLGKRYPLAKVIVMPVRVQGVEAPPEICGALRYANKHNVADLIITGRGGGSIEDLWAFNDERVARAIFESRIPVISAVGHEPDVTIADYVADLRAATPSNGAELAVPDTFELREALRTGGNRLARALHTRLERSREQVRQLAGRRVLTSPSAYIDDRRMLLDHVQKVLASEASRLTADRRAHFTALVSALDAMSPLKVLSRGYGMVQTGDGSIVKSVKDVSAGEDIAVILRDGHLACRVLEGKNNE